MWSRICELSVKWAENKSGASNFAVFCYKWIVDHLLGKPTRANRKNTIKTKVVVSDRMVAPEAA